ncbi:MAG TPA: heparinase II/III family protein, partial [Humibacter sp.]|nr:heparinase II/III family protein [Humibacter sp.]
GRAHAGVIGGLTLAAKGGTNGENHNHKDLGSFIVADDGLPLIVDIGKPTYTAQTFGPDRYDIRAMQSGWHNAPAPRGLEQGDGAGFHAAVVHVPSVAAEPGSDQSPAANDETLPIELELELGAAYPLREGDSWRRTFRLASARRIEIDDRWRLHGDADAPTLVHLVVAGVVEAIGAGIRVSRDAAGIDITTAERIAPVIEVWELDDPELVAVWGPQLTRLTYEVQASDGRLTTIIEEAR